jgi:MFS family permease
VNRYSGTAADGSGCMLDNDPLWKLRHALAGLAIALLFSVLIAAMAGAALADVFGGRYGHRVAVYGALLLYVVVGAGVLFAKVLRHETRPLSLQRVLMWTASLWTWPLLLLAANKKP